LQSLSRQGRHKARTPAGRKLGVKDLTQSKIPDTEIHKQIQEGRRGDDGSIRMPSFKDSLKAEEIEALVGYVMTLRVPDKAKKPVTK
jgi:mono/diheme cytochrome c family protein